MTPDQLLLMRKAGRIVCAILDALEAAVKPGITTADLDALAARLIDQHGAKSAFLGYHGFPAVLCASVNDEVVHGIPSPRRVLRAGDLVKLDFGVSVDGWFGDSARTVPVGEIAPQHQKLIDVTKRALKNAIAQCRAGHRIGDLGHAIQSTAEAAGFSVVREFTGHGIGRALHEYPQVPNFGVRGKGHELRPGMTIAIEPMVNIGGPNLQILDDDWTAVTVDQSWSAHFEHTVLITAGAPELLTARA